MNYRASKKYIAFVDELVNIYENSNSEIEFSLKKFIDFSNKYFKLTNDDWSNHFYIDEKTDNIICCKNADRDDNGVKVVLNDFSIYGFSRYYRGICHAIGKTEYFIHNSVQEIATLEKAKRVILAISHIFLKEDSETTIKKLELIESSFTPTEKTSYHRWFKEGLSKIDFLLRDGLFVGSMQINNYLNLLISATMINISSDCGYDFEVRRHIDRQIEYLKEKSNKIDRARELEKCGF